MTALDWKGRRHRVEFFGVAAGAEIFPRLRCRATCGSEFLAEEISVRKHRPPSHPEWCETCLVRP